MSHSCSIHLSSDGYLGSFYILVIAAMNIGVLMFFQISVLGSFGYIHRSGITGSKGRCFKQPHVVKVYCTRHHSYKTLLPSLSPARTFLLFYTTLSYEILFMLCLNYVCGSLSYPLWTSRGVIWWLWYLDTWQKEVLKNYS